MSGVQLSLVDFFAFESPFATEFRRLLVNLKQHSKKGELKSILITSSTLSEGKSTICSFLGMTAAKKGLKTLLIDCDLRRPTLHKNFVLARDLGLVEILSEGAAVKSTIKKTGLDKLDIITAGKATAHPADIFDAKALSSLIAEMKFYYDLILVDCAPVLPVSDPMLLAQEVDGVLMVVKAGETQRDLTKRATEILNSSGGAIVGVVMNNMNDSLPAYYSYSHYDYYSSAEEEKPRRNKGNAPPQRKLPVSIEEMPKRNTIPR
ncbi:MAG: CpsD/CapB family tyrosine-protein kinase [candidate division Zixibacteria bacterium]|nr:CpsD/CapB family tyrosine-protein kinase [candidate division Zixibacteria bacterium]